MEKEVFKIISTRDIHGYYTYTWKYLTDSTKDEWLESKDSFGSEGVCLGNFLEEVTKIRLDVDELDESLMDL